jgi:hypothetical protein
MLNAARYYIAASFIVVSLGAAAQTSAPLENLHEYKRFVYETDSFWTVNLDFSPELYSFSLTTSLNYHNYKTQQSKINYYRSLNRADPLVKLQRYQFTYFVAGLLKERILNFRWSLR